MKIAGREIGPGCPPYIVAEVSCNHGGLLTRAIDLIHAAKAAGADAVKFQCYTADTITMNAPDNPEFIIKGGPWHGRHLYDLYTETQTPFEWFPALFKRAADIGITAFASVFDRTSVDALEELNCPAYKIASMEITDIPLIKYAAATGKPLIISTGMASQTDLAQVGMAVEHRTVAALACVSGYPTPVSEAPLYRFQMLYSRYGVYGVSDHTLGWGVPVAAVALGACIIEKHLTLDRHIDTEDAAFSLTPPEFAQMTAAVRDIWRAMQPSEAKSEDSSRQLRRSLYVTADMKQGEMFTEANVRSIRPAYGLPPKNLPDILGKRASQDIRRGTALAWTLVENQSLSPVAQDPLPGLSFGGC